MFERILIGFDGTPASGDALSLGAHLAHRTGAQVTLAACFPHLGPLPPARAYILDEESEALSRTVRKLVPDLEFEIAALPGTSPSAGLADLASERAADLIVIGSTHRGAIGRVLPGSVGERLLRTSPVAVSVAPRDYASHGHADIGVIGVAYDGSPESRLALEKAAWLARRTDSRVRVISVIDLRGRAGELAELSKVASGQFDAEVERAGRSVPAEIEHDVLVLEGDPAVELAARGVELDLLLIGSSGHGPVGKVLLGSVSSEIMRTAPCPVVAVPRLAAASAMTREARAE